MKIKNKRLFALLLAMTMTVSASATVRATDSEDTNNQWREDYYNLYDTYLSQREQINSLRDQLEREQNQSTSTPKPKVYAPLVKLLSPQTVTMGQNETQDIVVTLKNIGTSSASNVLTQIQPDGAAPFTVELLDNGNNTVTIAENATQTMKLRITTDENAEAGNYAIQLTHAFKNRESVNITETDTLNIRISANTKTPTILMRNFSVDKTGLRPGDAFTLTATIENTGEGDASELQTVLDGLDSEIYLTGDLNTAYIKTLEADGSQTMRFNFKTTSKIKNGVYPLTFKTLCKDSAGNAIENTFTYFVNVVSGGENRPFVELRDIKAPSGTVGVGQNATVSMQLFNNGQKDAGSIKITAIPADGEALVPQSANIQVINSLPVGTSRPVSFSFTPTDKAGSHSYVIGFHVEYETGFESTDGTDEVFAFDQYSAITVHNPNDKGDDAKSIKPKMIVSAYSVDPGIVRAGREFDLNLTFQNANSLKAVNNIKITLTAVETTERKGSVFTPVDGSNTFYIDELAPKGEISKTLRMFTVPDADPRTYNIAVNFDYQDEDYSDYTESEQISINVKQVTRIETSEPFIPESSPVFQPIYINFSVINSGRVSLNNLRVRVDGDFDTTSANMYIGNLGKGNQIYYEGNFMPTHPGDLDGTIVVYGEDDTGEIIEYSHPFTVNAYEMTYEEGMDGGGFPMDGMMPGDMENSENKVLQFLKNPIVWGVTAVVVIVAVVVVVRVVRKKKRIDFDE